eukprot:Skav234748  [mRNA]  locus=scaffold14:668467:669270:+ [translate_table: standard]
MFKGSASQVSILLPLIHHYAFLLLPDKTKLEWQSFDELIGVHLILQRLRIKPTQEDIAALDAAQQKHQSLFVRCYADLVRPKHHLRMHLPHLIRKFGFYADCFPAEAKHQLYKGLMADSHSGLSELGTGTLSKALLGKLLARCVNTLQSTSWIDGMHGKIYSEEEVQAHLPGCRAQVSAAYQIGALVIKTGDLLCWGDQSAGIVVCFAGDHMPVLIFEPLQLTQHIHRGAKLWTRAENKDPVRVDALLEVRVPTWRYDEGQTILALT